MLRGDAGPEVLYCELDLGFQKPCADQNSLAGLAVPEGIFNQIAENLAHGVGIGQNQRVRRSGRF